MKKFFLLALSVAFAWNSDAKPVDESKAKLVGFNFLSSQANEGLTSEGQLELVYTSSSANGQVKYFYVFNTNTGGFVMVSADDQVIPVFAYSTEAGFDPNRIPDNAATWLNNYASEIAYVIENDLPASLDISEKWAALQHANNGPTGNKTTASVSQLLTTKWGQSGFVSEMCPFDFSANQNSVTGCVATAMAQVMKYWNWPLQGTGAHSYYHWDYGNLSADFGNTTYQWASMPTGAVNSSNNAVATLMYHAGVSVDMNYSPTSSGSYVIDAMDPQSAENALRSYFKYDPNLQGVVRSNYTTQGWIQALKNEIDNAHPVIYAGFGSGGGHAWIADGYDNNNFFHINWGWGGLSDGYFSVDNMNPPALGQGGGSGGFHSGQHAIIGIQPLTSATPDKYEQNNVEATAYALPVNFSSNTANINTDGSTFHTTNDMDYYTIALPAGDNYTLSVRLQDAAASTNGKTYSVNAKFSIRTPTGISWSPYYNESISTPVTVNGGGIVKFRVTSFTAAEMGDYMLDINVTRIPTGITEVNSGAKVAVYPNPATSDLNIDLTEVTGNADIAVVDLQGRNVLQASTEGNKLHTLPVHNLPNGFYLVRIHTANGTITEKISINR